MFFIAFSIGDENLTMKVNIVSDDINCILLFILFYNAVPTK